jgi:D-inositol-3-phosphate glycosyltransferase
MLKIVMVAERHQLRVPAGTSRTPHLVALSEALATAGHEVTVLVRRDRPGEELVAPRVRMLRCKDLPAALASCRPDVVHAHCLAVGPAAFAGARALDVPFVFSPHDSTDPHELAVLQSADQVLATFTAQVPMLLAAGVPRQNISVVPYGVDIDHFTPDGGSVDRHRAQRVIALGGMVPPSGFGTPVAALRALPDAELVLVGAPRRGTHAAELRDYAHSLGVADQVRLAGPVPHTDLPALLRSADLMVCSPWEATFGTAALEAMACGIPVIANGMGGLADTVVHDVTGTHVAPRKPRELAAALRRMLSHKAICEQHGAAGRDRVTVRYSWNRIAEETVHAYRRAGAADPEVVARENAAAARKRSMARG